MSTTSQQLANLASDTYHRPPVQSIDGKQRVVVGGKSYVVVEHVDQPSGYQGTIYQDTTTADLIVAHRGMELDRQALKDVGTGLLMFLLRSNPQAADAIELTRNALRVARSEGGRDGKVPEVMVTGHSLGGTLAQITAHYFDLRGETFNAYGAVSLDRQIPEGGHRVINHVMAGDAISAVAKHYGAVRIYATKQEIATLKDSGYENQWFDFRNPTAAARNLISTSHGIANFLASPNGVGSAWHRSVLEDPNALALYRDKENKVLIDKYRTDIWEGLQNSLLQPLRKTLPAGEPARGEAVTTLTPRSPIDSAHSDHKVASAAARPEAQRIVVFNGKKIGQDGTGTDVFVVAATPGLTAGQYNIGKALPAQLGQLYQGMVVHSGAIPGTSESLLYLQRNSATGVGPGREYVVVNIDNAAVPPDGAVVRLAVGRQGEAVKLGEITRAELEQGDRRRAVGG